MRLIVTLPLAVVAGLGIGFTAFRSPQPAAAALRTEDIAKPAPLPGAKADTGAKTQRLIAAALRKGPPLDRDNEIHLAIEAFTAEDFRRLVADVGALKAMTDKLTGMDPQTGRNLISGIVAHWVKLDRDAVVGWAPRALELIPKSDRTRGWILNALASELPAEMLALVSSHQDAKDRVEIIRQAMQKLAARDSAKAGTWLASCQDPADRREAETAFRLGIVQADPLRAIELASAIENRYDATSLLCNAAEYASKQGPGILRQLMSMPMKPWMASAMISEFAEHDPDAAIDLVMKWRGDSSDHSSSLGTVFTALAKRDPAECMARLEGLEGKDLAAAVSAIGYIWAGREPAAALAWLMQRPASQRNSPNGRNDAVTRAFSDWLETAPAEARAWADSQPAGETRDTLQSHIAHILAIRGEPAEALQLLARQGKAGDPVATAKVASAWARRDPQAAADWAITQEPGAMQSRALAGIVGTWANDDPAGVENWLAQFPPGEARDRSVNAFLWRSSAWTTTKEQRIAEFDAWFPLIDDPWQRGLVARASFFQRRERDPASARAWLSSLPNVDPELIRTTLRDYAH